MPRNAIQFQKSLSEPDFHRLYGEEHCFEAMEKLGWPGGFQCPACGNDRAHRLAIDVSCNAPRVEPAE